MCCTDKPMWLSGGGVTMVVVVKKRRKASAALALVLCGAAVGGCLASAGGRDSCDGGAFVEDREGTTVLAMDRLPYMVSIRSHGSRDHVCSGVLLSAFHILTVAHCVDPTSSYSAGPRPTVYIGSTSADAVNDDPNVEVRVVARTHFHESWSPSKIQNCPNNLALLTVERAVNKTPVRLLTDHFRLTTGQTLAAAGWGAGPQGPRLGEGIFGTLKAEAQQFLDSSACNRTSLWSGAVREGTVCGLSREAAASCIGLRVRV
ncbi:unnamed protein product [Ostreobium quekettii]|uniref:Peptidase S1 domain-containing protein n=1 Tax=Ostreobium quekettii TaxID=121088 RepID=A0A8S1J687_9CHLO|nr:unnamed protein product [Ostreobium quekettii]